MNEEVRILEVNEVAYSLIQLLVQENYPKSFRLPEWEDLPIKGEAK